MRILQLLFIFLCLCLFQFQAQAEDSCQAQIGNYVIRGNLTATYPGARLWRLDQLKKDSADKKNCAPEIFERAVSESENYWTHIDSKYHCGSVDSKTKRDPDQCSDSLNDNVLSNKAYLVFIHLEKQFKPNCPAQTSHLDVLGKTASLGLHQTALALQNMVGKNKCEAIPLKDRIGESSGKSPEADLAQDLARGLASCLSGVISGFFKEGILKSLQSIWSTLKDPWGTMSALHEIAKELIKNPAKTLFNLANNLVKSFHDSYLAKYENFDCYSAAKKSQIMCSSMGQGAAAVVEFLVGGQAFKLASKITKATTKLAKSSSTLLNTVEAPTAPALAAPSAATTPALSRTATALGKSDVPSAKLGKPVDPVKPSEPGPAPQAQPQPKPQPSPADIKKQELEAKLKQQAANRDIIEEGRIKTLNAADDLREIKKKLQLPENFSDADVIKHIKKLRSKYHPDKQFVPEEVSNELSKIILKLKTQL